MSEFYVYTTDRGGLWLDADEHTWTTHFTDAACFTSAELAKEIADRETGGSITVTYVLGLAA